ncbi:LPS-assembly protein LptD [Falsirhodobacter sp. 20TX0035]|uniref:LPS-assembly protein LptD n=1 Tax=Falsirhodobacter sp. 20TX0035 TaxID=3022019 RepID=UPI0023300B0F|nr:LPS assembly protein LptD [Falsirhodobacter sp. 20TX0035]MDB6453139.1 LPS assembly protein LptD [Falsirhodobacter sp. 20TX0035]
MRLRSRLLGSALVAFALFAPPALAQDRATLVADDLQIRNDNVLTATGGVEVFYQGQRMRASRVEYDKGQDSLTISGPITLDDGKGTVVLADQAQLSGDLRDGILQSARVVLNQQLQLASNQVNRIGDRYTRLGPSVASSCQVCASNPTPLWEIRASEIIHDEQKREIYFQNAQLRMMGVPVAYIPRLRMPDPTVKRMRGVLQPTFRSTSDFGAGVQVPYFFPIGESADLTLTPYLSAKNARSMGYRYRQAFNAGWMDINGAFSRDELMDNKTRGYLFATGQFALPDSYTLNLRVDTVSDPAYFYDYGLEERDRLESSAEITRTRRNEYISGRILNFHSIREGEPNSTIPSLVGEAQIQRRFSGGPLGGEAGLQFSLYGAERTSDNPLDTDKDADDDADGRDTQRASIGVDWRRNYILPAGIMGTALGTMRTDIYNINQDVDYEGTTTRVSGALGVELRWPWVKTAANGASHVISPIVQAVWSPNDTPDIPDEDSTLVEFDESNLFALNRFSGHDEYERGARLNLGVNYTRVAPEGWSFGTTVGRVFREQDLGQFSNASGLDEKNSDWLAQFQIMMSEGLIITNRTLFDDDLRVTKSELRMQASLDRFDLAANYVKILPDEEEDRETGLSEMTVDARYQVTDAWSARATSRYDFAESRAVRAGVGAEFRNECLAMEVYLSRKFSSSTNVDPSTEVGLAVDLLGFGSKKQPGPAGTCRS